VLNPLLDDVNLQGANGILVNITAGPDFTMAEFDEVGRTVEAFASEDATIVIGTVLDPDMQDEVRVTVVATGLNRAPGGKIKTGEGNRAPIQLVRNATTGQPEFPVDAISSSSASSSESRAPSVPSFSSSLRGESTKSEPAAATGAADFGPDSYLDIPAFLRRQAD